MSKKDKYNCSICGDELEYGTMQSRYHQHWETMIPNFKSKTPDMDKLAANVFEDAAKRLNKIQDEILEVKRVVDNVIEKNKKCICPVLGRFRDTGEILHAINCPHYTKIEGAPKLSFEENADSVDVSINFE